MKKLLNSTVTLASVMLVLGCDKPASSFSLLASEATFKQSVAYVPRKVDILWVVDSSGSMASSQTNLANNFQQFIQDFQTKNFDFHMAVTDTGGYLDNHYNTLTRSAWRQGTASPYSGVAVMDKNTPNLSTVFAKNIKTGTTGTGDERAFSSFKKSLENNNNNGFLRPGAFLAVIIVSDEDDFSHYDWNAGISSYYFTENYADANMFSVQSFKDYLTTLTGSTPANAANNFTVHTISARDQACVNTLGNAGQKISQRYPALSSATGGLAASICAPMSGVLDQLSKKTIELAATFQLDREPYVDTLRVVVDGTTSAQSAVCGWTYDAASRVISFHGSTCIPAAGASVQIFFEPKTAAQ